jgi:DNA-binding sugar fermentation-stimulating protein
MSKTQIIKCPKCKSIFAACLAPLCYTDKEWIKNLKEYVQKGFEVDLIESSQLSFERCKCNQQLSLFK